VLRRLAGLASNLTTGYIMGGTNGVCHTQESGILVCLKMVDTYQNSCLNGENDGLCWCHSSIVSPRTVGMMKYNTFPCFPRFFIG
jgi:hypothetical protein